jgi:tetratricopeptide (TPR) repeat protein
MRRLLATISFILTAAALTACAPKARMDVNREAASQRWQAARSQILFSLAQQQFDTGDLDKSEKTITQAISTDPDESRYHILYARILMERGELEKAFNVVDQAMQIDRKRYEDAVAAASAIGSDVKVPQPHNPEAHYTMGVILQRWQRYESALTQYDEAYHLAPDKVQYLLAVGETLVKLDRVDEAITRLQAKLVYFENNPAIRVAVGRMQMLKGDNAAAVRLLREAAVLAPDDPTIAEHAARAEMAAGLYADAAPRLIRILAHPSFESRNDLRLMLGECQVRLNQSADARKTFLEITRRDPNLVEGWLGLAELSLATGDRIRLTESARRLIALAPQRYEGHMIRGIIESQSGNIDAAIISFDDAARLAPQTAQPLILKGMALEQLGRRSEAIAAYQQALKVAPDNENIRRLISAVGVD